ncbi:MAG TPA: hypothetical protein VFE33_09980 [Thermoanaerobaculia bacterium]|nr:hypothetical protein [Thermoanaerobaculia bacterium]
MDKTASDKTPLDTDGGGTTGTKSGGALSVSADEIVGGDIPGTKEGRGMAEGHHGRQPSTREVDSGGTTGPKEGRGMVSKG